MLHIDSIKNWKWFYIFFSASVDDTQNTKNFLDKKTALTNLLSFKNSITKLTDQ